MTKYRRIKFAMLGLIRITEKKMVCAVLEQDIKKTKATKLFGFSRISVSKYAREFKLNGASSFHYKKAWCKRALYNAFVQRLRDIFEHFLFW